MNKKNSKKFVCFLDSYNKTKSLVSTDYANLISAINMSYIENIVYDPSLVGKSRTTKRQESIKIGRPAIDISNDMYYNQFSDSTWNSCVMKLNVSNNSVGNNKDSVYSLWQSQYSLWQKQHEAVLNIKPIEEPPKKDRFII